MSIGKLLGILAVMLMLVGPVFSMTGCGGGGGAGAPLAPDDDANFSPDTDTTRDGDDFR